VAVAVALCLAVWTAPALAQCKGDFNGDGVVTIDELIVAVENALSGCEVGQPRFVDNGDGTISDRRTGLMWEKKSALDGRPNDDDLHDGDNTYQWAGTCLPSDVEVLCQPTAEALSACPAGAAGCAACADGQTCDRLPSNQPTVFEWVSQLNAAAFAGHGDWRVPTLDELEGLVDRTRSDPAITPEFSGPGCDEHCTNPTDVTCSCTASRLYWTATPVVDTRARAWSVRFDLGTVEAGGLTFDVAVRAVRTAS
jgi:hypothetical protein